MVSPPRDEDIRQVMAQCPGCTKHRAHACLKGFLPPVSSSSSDDGQSQSSVEDDHISTMLALDEHTEDQPDLIDEDRPWLPRLPILPFPNDFASIPREPQVWKIREILGAIQHGLTNADGVRTYLGYYDEETLKMCLNDEVDGFPAMFYIVSTNDVDLIREWVRRGGDPNATWGPDALPLVAFSVLRGGRTLRQSAKTLATLLRFGAHSWVIPKAFYDPYCRDLPEGGPATEELGDLGDHNKQWCTPELHGPFTKALSLTQRYDLYRSSKVKPHSGREKEVLNRQGAGEVMGVHQMIVAQSIATRWLKRKLTVYLALQKRKPLILVFAGPSGHGKTELARRFGELMSLDLQVVDCTIFKHDNELFGPRPPYSGYEEGSPLNNFLTSKAGERSIVFMDEFEKTNSEIHNTLLLPFQNGQYEDRRTGKMINCSKTIWILATNKLDDTIHQFCSDNEKVIFHSEDEEAQDRVVGKLCRQLRTEFVQHFGAPLGGRITEILPFLVFSPQESPLIVHKALMDLEADIMKRVRLALNKEEDVYVGNITVRIKKDAAVCTTIAVDEYDKKTGARSLAQAVDRVVEDPLVSQYLQDGDELDENQPNIHFDVDVNVDGEVEVRLVP
ncbi:P-loop containing nucleoside triphosphate hydrolase protein [Hypoxylon sp. FL1284]|nr:P-loop containing nucleoside triphosphate hydrolase protein [Hypoxylon sp. FL1284]